MEGLSLDFITGALKVQLPPVIVAKAGWKFDIEALVGACGLLGLEKEVRFRFTSGGKKSGLTSGTFAAHRIKIDYETMQFYHGITISQELPIDEANDALWHELRHAWQAEAYAKQSGHAVSSFNEVYKQMAGEHGATYENNRFEIDACNYAANRVSEGKWLISQKK